ncbi:haloacid dehalogenase-like hydrolase [Selenomonas sp. oral taxon 137 str. F0430]|uniref:HAD-IC family P-type ATPase n=1 Tax=Selenomonas sp. oral taxon 137 TaxID=712531 RepID=UPI0001EB27E2|nr:HAD-IC family P-type ATPase [Selenomonas sp. oral taxon 137]EFR41544.1 haloacid dehalogenase-like hydrolase [Selenomonas sp. oral taxon 137 str. F0430]
MKKYFSSFFHFIGSVILASVVAGYWYVAGDMALETASEVFVGVFLAASPLPFILSRRLIALRIKRCLKASAVTCGRTAALTELMRVDTVAFNRSGTLTEGSVFISGLVPEGMTQGSLLSLAASAEREASHPYAHAIYDTAVQRGLHLQRHSAARETESFGVEALIARTPVRVGKKEFLQDEDVEISAALLTRADQLATSGQTPLFVSSSKYARGIIAVRDDVRADVRRTLGELRRRGLTLMLLTGETKRLANATGKELHIAEVRGDLTAADKAREIRLLQSRGAVVAMVGDPEADQPALRAADISIGCPSSFIRPHAETEEKDPLHEELLRSSLDADTPAAQPVEPLMPAEDAAYFEAQALRSQGRTENYTPDIILDVQGLPGLAALLDAGDAARSRAKQNSGLAFLFLLFFTVLAAGAPAFFGGIALPFVFVVGSLVIMLVLLAVNALR